MNTTEGSWWRSSIGRSIWTCAQRSEEFIPGWKGRTSEDIEKICLAHVRRGEVCGQGGKWENASVPWTAVNAGLYWAGISQKGRIWLPEERKEPGIRYATRYMIQSLSMCWWYVSPCEWCWDMLSWKRIRWNSNLRNASNCFSQLNSHVSF